MGGYSLAHAMMLLIPEAWSGNKLMDENRRAFYEYHAALMEPWDGPAAVPSPTAARSARRSTATACARPATWSPNDDLVVMGSEMGVLRHRRKAHRQEVAPAARQDVPDRPGAGPHHRRRRDQGRAVRRANPTATG
jgi:hypothetical protein